MSEPEETLPDLEHYALKADYGRLTGVSVACHAIRDAYLLMHVGVGCKNKVTHLLDHDWAEHCNLRQGWTEVGDRDLITGASVRVGPYLRSWQKRMNAGFVCVVSVTFLELAGEDVADEVEKAAAASDVPVALIPALGFEGDEFKGYASVCRAVLERVPFRETRPKAKQVSLLGHWFDRYEQDQSANLAQLAGMLKPLGLDLGPVLCSGDSYASMMGIAESGVLVAMPYLRPARKKLRRLWKRTGRQPVETDLPIGLAGTSRWLRAVAEAGGVNPRLARAYADKREARAMAPLRKMQSRWRSLRVAVFAETPLAGGLCNLLMELGLTPVLVGLRGESLGGEDDFRAILAREGRSLPKDARVIERPSLARGRDAVLELWREGSLDGVLGSATELAPLRTLADEERPRTPGKPPPFALEVGFPCREYHALRPMPLMGYAGAATLAQRLVSPPRL